MLPGRLDEMLKAERALESAVKYSLVANSIKSEIIIEPKIDLVVQADAPDRLSRRS